MSCIWHIVIPVFNPPASLLGNLRKLEAASPGAVDRVLLVDDGSTNGIPQQAAQVFSGLTLLQGDGSLWWCGAMKVGMEYGLANGADVVVWLNHDCVPDPATLEQIVELASKDGNGAVSAWCYSEDDPSYPVNPGFRNLKEIPVDALKRERVVAVDGVNGNCVALNSSAIRAVGLPDAIRHPHYGDGPYTYMLHKAGYRNLVVSTARASLEREYDRCVSVFWRCAFWSASFCEKLQYYYLSRKSQFHWRIKYYTAVAYRRQPFALCVYLGSMALLFADICRGHWMGIRVPKQRLIRLVCAAYQGKFPHEGLIESLDKIGDGK